MRLPIVSRFLRGPDRITIRDVNDKPIRDGFLDPFDDEIIRMTLFVLADRNWKGHRFETELLGTPLYLKRIKSRGRAANGWTGLGSGTEIGRRDGAWKFLISSFDPNQISAERAQEFLKIGWQNMTIKDDYDLYTGTDFMGRPTGLGSIPNATEMLGDREIFTQDMMIMRLYSTDQ